LADLLFEDPAPGEKFTAWKLVVIVLNDEAVIELSPPPLVLGVMESVGEVWFAALSPREGVSTLREGVRLSDALDDALLRGSPDLYAFSPCVSL
jgi:hypothetical protein